MDLDTPTPPVEEGGARAGEPASVAEPEQGVGGVEHEGEGGDDLDFAMFLGQEEEEKEKERERKELASPPDPQVVFEGLPHVWNGIVSLLFTMDERFLTGSPCTDQHADRFELASRA